MPKILPKPVDKKDLKLFRLVNGQHIGFDYMAEPETVTDDTGKVTGYIYPSKLFDAATADNHVWATGDLVKQCKNKFQATAESSDEYRRAQRQENRIIRTPSNQPVRADEMDKADAEVSPHNPPLDQPDIADRSRLAENQTETTSKSKQETAGRGETSKSEGAHVSPRTSHTDTTATHTTRKNK
jgi:hypothetical protein